MLICENGIYPRAQPATVEQISTQEITSSPSAPSIVHQMVSMAWLMLMQMHQLVSGFSASPKRSTYFIWFFGFRGKKKKKDNFITDCLYSGAVETWFTDIEWYKNHDIFYYYYNYYLFSFHINKLFSFFKSKGNLIEKQGGRLLTWFVPISTVIVHYNCIYNWMVKSTVLISIHDVCILIILKSFNKLCYL